MTKSCADLNGMAIPAASIGLPAAGAGFRGAGVLTRSSSDFGADIVLSCAIAGQAISAASAGSTGGRSCTADGP